MVAERLGEYLESKNISFYAFENSLETGRGTISKAVKENKSIGSHLLENIFKICPDLNPVWLLTGKQQMIISPTENVMNPKLDTFVLKTDRLVENQLVPLYDIEAIAGLVPLFKNNNLQEPIDYISIPRLPKCDGAVYITGDSMYPLLKSGDIILYKEIHDIKNEIFWGEMYLLSLEISGEEFVTVKYIQKSEKEGFVKLVSQNKHHQDKDVALDKIRALAIVKASIRINSMN